MTAAELIAIVCDVPREALGDVRWTTDPENALFFVRGVAGFIPESVAESAFIGSMTAWLLGLGSLRVEKLNGYSVFHGWNGVDYEGDSLVAALAAACKEAA